MADGSGLRESKRRATDAALREAALRLALAHGPDNVRVADIAAAAGVSLRTYNNYFPSREHAIVAAILHERAGRIRAAVLSEPVEVGLADAIINSIVDQYTKPSEHARDTLLMITANPSLQAVYLEASTGIDEELASAIRERIAGIDPLTAEVLAASVAAALRIALQQWMGPAAQSSTPGLVIPTAALDDQVRAAIRPLTPALQAATRQHTTTHHTKAAQDTDNT